MRIQGDVRRLPFRDASFDLLFVIRLFQHLSMEDKEKALGEISRVTRRWVILSFYRINSIHMVERRFTGRVPKMGMISPYEFRLMAERWGLSPIRIKPLFNFHAQTFALLEKK